MTDPVDFLLRAAMRLPRPAIERLTAGLIDGLDDLDGDPDLEDDDPAGGNVEDEGESLEAEGWCLPVGQYGSDQRTARSALNGYHVDEGRNLRP